MHDPITIPASDARELLGEPFGEEAFDGWIPVADDPIRESSWTEHRRLIIRDADGRHYSARYERPLTDGSGPSPWEYDEQVTFQPVYPRTQYVKVTDYVTEEPADLTQAQKIARRVIHDTTLGSLDHIPGIGRYLPADLAGEDRHGLRVEVEEAINAARVDVRVTFPQPADHSTRTT